MKANSQRSVVRSDCERYGDSSDY